MENVTGGGRSRRVQDAGVEGRDPKKDLITQRTQSALKTQRRGRRG
jgi:hypothetical protein